MLRWGLWMRTIINSFLRQSPDPTWYNQDGAIRSGVAIATDVAHSPGDFRQFSLTLFLGLLAYDWVRILIWFDHMGLRVSRPWSICPFSAATAPMKRRRDSSATTDARAPFRTASAVSAPGVAAHSVLHPAWAGVGPGLDRGRDAGARRGIHAGCNQDARLRLCCGDRRHGRCGRSGARQGARQIGTGGALARGRAVRTCTAPRSFRLQQRRGRG